jgi:hypothetical protein
MLFDIRSRGRRQTVRVIYLFLALVMVAGLVLVGVGTGSNQGGLLNAFTNGSSGGGSQIADQQLTKAIKATKKDPQSAGNWSTLLEARWSAAGSGTNFNTTSGEFTAGGKKQLTLGAVAWQRYLKLTNGKPTTENSILAARVYQSLSQWKSASNAWEFAAQTQPSLKPYLCMALSSYAGGQTAKGDLATGKAVALAPKLQQLTLKSTLKSAKSSATTAQQATIANC